MGRILLVKVNIAAQLHVLNSHKCCWTNQVGCRFGGFWTPVLIVQSHSLYKCNVLNNILSDWGTSQDVLQCFALARWSWLLLLQSAFQFQGYVYIRVIKCCSSITNGNLRLCQSLTLSHISECWAILVFLRRKHTFINVDANKCRKTRKLWACFFVYCI